MAVACSGCMLDDIDPPGPPCPPRVFVSSDGEYRQFEGYHVHVDDHTGFYYVRPDYEVLDENSMTAEARAEARKHRWEEFVHAVEVNSKANEFITEASAKQFYFNLDHVSVMSGMNCFLNSSCSGEDGSGIFREYDFSNSFLNNRCPKEFSVCDLELAGGKYNYYCKQLSSGCASDSDCDQAGIVGWKTGHCENGICLADSCMSGYMLDGNSCVALECSEGTHVYVNPETGLKECEADTVEHCGAHDISCADRVPGWGSGSCELGKCVATQCDEAGGYDLKDGKCLAACIGTQVKCGGLCRDPLTDNDYCGATGTINSCASEGEKCAAGKVCVGGKCLQNSCSGDYPDICEITNEDGEKKN